MRTPEKSSGSMAFALTYGQETAAMQGGIPSPCVEGAPRVDGPNADPLVGTVFGGRYRLEMRLAEGAMGVVYRARHVTLGSTVAVKVLHERCANDSATALRFDREAEAQARLDHPNCVRVFDAGVTTSGVKYLVMPLLAGVELRDLMDQPMSVQRTTGLALQVLEGLDHAHGLGFVHRDIKPENIFVVRGEDGSEVAKLVDFGLVKTLGADASRPALTEAGTVFGTPWYMSPEQAVGDPISPRSDLYSLGAMMFEMLTGAPPFDADSFTVILRKHLISETPRLPTSVPASVASVVYRLLEKDPNARYPTARDASDALRAATANAAVAPAAPSLSRAAERTAFVDAPSVSRLDAVAADEWTLPSNFVDERQDSVLRSARTQARWIVAMMGLVASAAIVLGLLAASFSGPPVSTAAETGRLIQRTTPAIPRIVAIAETPSIEAATPEVASPPRPGPRPRARTQVSREPTAARPRTFPAARPKAPKPRTQRVRPRARPPTTTPTARPRLPTPPRQTPRTLSPEAPPRYPSATLPTLSPRRPARPT